MRSWRSDQSRKFLYLLDKETMHLWRTAKTEGFGRGVVNGDELTRKIRVSLSGFVCTDFLAPKSPSLAIRLLGQGRCLPPGVLGSVSRKKSAGGQMPFLLCCFLNFLKLRVSICQGANILGQCVPNLISCFSDLCSTIPSPLTSVL